MHSSAYGKRRDEDPEREVACRGVVGAADHQGAPHHEHRGLAQPVLLEPERRCRVRDRQQEPTQRERDHRPTAEHEQHDQDREVGDVDRDRGRQQPSAADHPRQDRMGRVQGPRVAVGVGADFEVEEIVHQIVGDVGEHQPDRRQREQAPPHVLVVIRREQSRDCGCGERHRQHRRARDHEPARYGVHASGRRVGRPHHVTPVVEESRARVDAGFRCRIAHVGHSTPFLLRSKRTRATGEVSSVACGKLPAHYSAGMHD